MVLLLVGLRGVASCCYSARAPMLAALLAALLAAAGPGPGDALDGRPELALPSTEAPAPSPPTALVVPERRRWFALPVLFWLPETKLGFGATAGIHVDVTGAPRTSSIFAAALYTLDRQGAIDVAGDFTLRGGTVLAGRARAVHFPDAFYGLGPRTPSSARERFTRRSIEAVADVGFPVPGLPHLRAGPRLDLRAEEIRDRAPGGQLDSGPIAGADGFSAVSGGASVAWDTRDAPLWPSRGSLAQLWYVYAPREIGRGGGFGRGALDLRHFFPLGGGRVLGVQGYAEGTHGEVPFTLLPKLGSSRFVRGIREGRYRDRLEWAAQAELRLPVRGRISATTFAGGGDVAPALRDFSLRTVKVSGGAGLRYRLTDEGANVRVDVAASKLGVELYLLVLEAF